MVSAELWQRRFGGDPRMVGTTVTLAAAPARSSVSSPRAWRFRSLTLLTLFASTGLLLVIVGIYGVMAYWVG